MPESSQDCLNDSRIYFRLIFIQNERIPSVLSIVNWEGKLSVEGYGSATIGEFTIFDWLYVMRFKPMN
jgi:hypothetical protein